MSVVNNNGSEGGGQRDAVRIGSAQDGQDGYAGVRLLARLRQGS